MLLSIALIACESEIPEAKKKEPEIPTDPKGRPTRFTEKDTILYYDVKVEQPWLADERFMKARKKYEQDRYQIATSSRNFSDIYAVFDFKTPENLIFCYAEGIFAADRSFSYAVKSDEEGIGKFVEGGSSYYTPQTAPARPKYWCTSTFDQKKLNTDVYPDNVEANGATGTYYGPVHAVNVALDNWERLYKINVTVIPEFFYQPPTH
jgi:hypothetical protein